MRELPAELLKEPFTIPMAAAYGVTYKQLRGARVKRLFVGVYIGAHVEITVAVLAKAISLVLPQGAVVSASTASLLRGADVRRLGDLGIDITTLREGKVRRAGIRSSAAYLEAGDTEMLHGLLVTSAVRTAFDLARQKNPIERVVGVDAMLNRGGCDRDELAAYIADRRWWKGIRWAREALIHAEPLAESPQESRQRMRLIQAGLPRPQAQYKIYDVNGLAIYRLDHAYEQWKVAPEYDGSDHALTWKQDNERHHYLEDLGWWHRGYNSLSISDGGDRMVREVGDALVARGWRP